MNRTITVAICTHNNADMLDRSLRRLSRQRVIGATWELLIVDNASSDRTPELLREWMASGAFPDLRVVREERLGLSNARRAAIREARGELIAFVDDDCFLNRGWIQAAVDFARKNPRAGAFGGRVRICWEGDPTDIGVASEWLLARQDFGRVPKRLRPGVPLVGAGIVVRRRALDESGWVERGHFMGRTGKVLTAGDDAEIGFRISAAGWHLWYTPAMRIEHRLGAWRSEISYLSRLYYGCGLTLPYIWVLGGVYPRTGGGFRFVIMGLARVAKCLASALNYRIRGRRLQRKIRILEAWMHLGTVRAAFNLPEPEPTPEDQHAAAGTLVPSSARLAREP